MAGTSRVSGDAYARFCGRLVVKFLRPTRQADKLGHGGFEYIAKLFEIDPKTIRQGLKDLEEGLVRLESGSEKKGRKSRLTDPSGVERGILGSRQQSGRPDYNCGRKKVS